MDAKRERGFNLLELMVTLLVVGIVLGFGVPSFMEFQRNNAMTSAANDFVSAMQLARTEAVKRQVAVTLCESANPTAAVPACGVGPNSGYIVFVDDVNPLAPAPTDGNAVVDGGETVLLQRPAPGGTLAITADSTYLTYGPDGFVVPTAVGQVQPSLQNVLLCDDRGNRDSGGRSAARALRVSPIGRPQILRTQADVAAAAAATGGACP